MRLFDRPPGLSGQFAWLLAAGVGLALLPLALDPYWTRFAVFVFINIGLASAWNVIGGFAGYPSFGHSVFFGLGAYTGAILTVRYGLPFWTTLPLAGLAAGIFSLLFMPLFKQRGFYFALSTLAAALAVEAVVRSWTWVRGYKTSDHGWNLPNDMSVIFFYYLGLALLLACLASILLLIASRVGMALRAIHRDETVAASVGVDCARYKTIAFAFSAVWPGVFGAMYGPFLVYISAETVFDMKITLNMIVYSVFGGVGTFLGPIVGGVLLSAIDQIAWAHFLDYHSMIYGVVIVLIITFSPGGVLSWVRKPSGGLRS
ncbi:MAG: branched-chain amino acid ABC transporter permease [Betaproteobacteria bacterium]|nr:branched-chain amino acid ABC transporter permease [Betaproteobacteria bacterium]